MVARVYFARLSERLFAYEGLSSHRISVPGRVFMRVLSEVIWYLDVARSCQIFLLLNGRLTRNPHKTVTCNCRAHFSAPFRCVCTFGAARQGEALRRNPLR